MSEKIAISISTALTVAAFINKLTTGVIDPSDLRLATENIFERKTHVIRGISHLKRLMSQTWFTDVIDVDQFTTINDAIVAGEDYIG
jgi:hypothetical protein